MNVIALSPQPQGIKTDAKDKGKAQLLIQHKLFLTIADPYVTIYFFCHIREKFKMFCIKKVLK